MSTERVEALLTNGYRRLSEDSGSVHITFDDLFHSILFIAAIFAMGQFSSRVLKMPNLVGEIFAGILLGPNLAKFVPNPEAWVLLGEIGLILLVIEAGIDIDLATLKIIGARGILIAIVGSVLPIVFGMAIAFMLGVDTKGAIATGSAFGPTSLGIALNILKSGNILNTPVGQLIVSAAVIDDMIALVILSQLSALTGDINIASIVIPIISALAFLCLGGYVAVQILPGIINAYILSRIPKKHHAKAELLIMLTMLIGLMPATKYAKASFLMGAFVSGLTFCRSHSLHHIFVSQFKRILHLLMKIFFAASIGFQVPIKSFGSGTVIGKGLILTLALLGKLAVGFMVPNFNQSQRFSGLHFRDCLCTGFSMAAEGEFAFVIAVFIVDQKLIDNDLYAAIVLAVLLSTIFPPFALRFTIGYYNKKAEEALKKVEAEMEEELKQRQDDDMEANLSTEEREEKLLESIRNKTAAFLCVQTQSDSSWGLLHSLMNCMNRLGLSVIDHRSWHPRGVNTTLVNEVYVKDENPRKTGGMLDMDKRIEEIQEAIENVINQPGIAKVKVSRWYPGVVEEIVEQMDGNSNKVSIEKRLLSEADGQLERKRHLQTFATTSKTVNEILGESGTDVSKDAKAEPAVRARRRRQKMRSTPVVGGGLFEDPSSSNNGTVEGISSSSKKSFGMNASSGLFGNDSLMAEIIIKNDSFKVRVTREAYKNIRRGYLGEVLDEKNISRFMASDPPVVNKLQGFVRRDLGLSKINEEISDSESELGNSTHHDNNYFPNES